MDASDKNMPMTRLMKQCEVGRESSVRRLLQLRADPNIVTIGESVDNYGNKNQTYCIALIIACVKGRIELVRILLAAGADIHHVVSGLAESGYGDDGFNYYYNSDTALTVSCYTILLTL